VQVRVYFDWFYNMCIVGMIRILEHAKRKGEDIRFYMDYVGCKFINTCLSI